MKVLALLRLCWISRPRRGNLGAFLLMTLGVMALCFAAATEYAIYQEKQAPCQLWVTAGNVTTLNEETAATVRTLPDVLGVSGVYQLSLTVTQGEFTADLSVWGVDAAYLELTLEQGSLFPDSSTMPWLILSSETLSTVRDASGTAWSLTTPDTQVTLTVEGNAVPAGICGVFATDELEVAGYLSLSQGKALRSSSDTGYDSILVRCTDQSAAQSVAQQITALGYSVESTGDSRQDSWSQRQRDCGYQLVIGLLILLSALLWRGWNGAKEGAVRQSGQTTLRWLGLTRREIFLLRLMQGGGVVLLGVVMGVVRMLWWIGFYPSVAT